MNEATTKQLKERELPDDYPMRFGYLYVADGKVIRSENDCSVAEFKRRTETTSIMNCDIGGRDLWDHAL